MADRNTVMELLIAEIATLGYEGYIKKLDEYAKERKNEREAKIAKRAKNKGMEVEAYKEATRKRNNALRHRREAIKAREEIERLMKEIAYHEAKVAEYEADNGTI